MGLQKSKVVILSAASEAQELLYWVCCGWKVHCNVPGWEAVPMINDPCIMVFSILYSCGPLQRVTCIKYTSSLTINEGANAHHSSIVSVLESLYSCQLWTTPECDMHDIHQFTFDKTRGLSISSPMIDDRSYLSYM